MPHLCFGGAERLASCILAELGRCGHSSTLVVVGHKPEEADAAEAWFEPIVGEIIRLGTEVGELSRDLLHLVQRRQPHFLAFFGRSPALHVVPALRRAHPALRLVSFQFNEHELTIEHRLYADFLTLVVVEGAVVANTLLRHGVAEDRIAVVPSGVDLAQFKPPARATTEGAAPAIVGFIGRMDPIKGPLDFVAICGLLRDRRVRFVMAGDGPAAGAVQRAIRRAGLSSRLAWQGRLPVAQLPAFYRQLSVLVVPSTLDGRPLVVQEAQACGVPVVASAVGSIPDLVDDGVTGFLCEPGDVAGFGAAVRRLLDDDELRRKIGAAGRAKVVRDGGLAASLPTYLFALLGRATSDPREGAAWPGASSRA